jgi:recombination protein RecA
MLKKKEKKEDKTVGMAVLDDTLKAIQTKFGEGSIMKLGDTPKVNINTIPTGSIGLDMALGVGGIPRGRIIEIFDPEKRPSPSILWLKRRSSAEFAPI